MSDTDNDDSPIRDRLDLKSKCPHYSQVDSTLDLTPQSNSYNRPPELDDESRATDVTTDLYERYFPSQCFKTTTTDFSANQNAMRRGVQRDNSISGTAPNTGMPVCYAPPVETEPYQKGGEFLEPPIPTTLQRSN